jgi:hypothetical protein
MDHYKMTFLDRDDIHVEAEDMMDAIDRVPAHANDMMISCEEMDSNGRIVCGIYQRPRNENEEDQLLYALGRELRMLPADDPNREFLRGKDDLLCRLGTDLSR